MKIKTKRGARRIRNQRVITRRFVTTDYTGCPYITAGKRYVITEWIIDNFGYTVNDRGGECTVVMHKPSVHLDGHDWQWGVI